MIVAPNSPIPRAKARAAPAPRPLAASGSAMRKNTRPGPAPRVRAAEGSVGLDRLEGGDRGADVERAGDEGHRQNDGDLGERDVEPERVDGAAEQAEAPEGGQEPDACDGRWEHEWQLDQRDDEIARSRPAGRDPVGRRSSERDDQQHRDGVRLERHDECIFRGIGRQRRNEVLRRNTQEDRRDREQQEQQGDARREQERSRKILSARTPGNRQEACVLRGGLSLRREDSLDPCLCRCLSEFRDDRAVADAGRAGRHETNHGDLVTPLAPRRKN